MVRYAAECGINYYDTAYPYHNAKSEIIMGKALKQLPRESYFLATKYPGHQVAASYDPAATFEEQLEKCQVSYFDFYLLHNVCENSIGTYLDPRWGIVDYFLEQRRAGRIRHLGFSSHGMPDNLERFLGLYGGEMEFCQIQLNYLDWTLQDAKAKYGLLEKYGIPVWVMEPVRGGKLAHLPKEAGENLARLRPGVSDASWAFRWLLRLPNVKMILSGMSDLEQMADNARTFGEEEPLTDEEAALLAETAESMKNSVPCTACRYCCDGCPKGLDIPLLLSLYNDMRFSPNFNIRVMVDSLDEGSRPSACVQCGKCARSCPQQIDVPKELAAFSVELEKIPNWAEMCRQREEAARKLRSNSLA